MKTPKEWKKEGPYHRDNDERDSGEHSWWRMVACEILRIATNGKFNKPRHVSLLMMHPSSNNCLRPLCVDSATSNNSKKGILDAR